uniref:Uncharacterized protein n=1 Tax=Eptatretus burgeri TaxID=7764 RepID=A0A8C4N4C2_EPTBU
MESSNLIIASQTALEKELELCTLAIHHYYSNNYDKAAAILKQSSGLGLYIPVTQATLAVMAAMLQFEPAAMETAIQRLREALDAISRFRRKTGRDIPSEGEILMFIYIVTSKNAMALLLPFILQLY